MVTDEVSEGGWTGKALPARKVKPGTVVSQRTIGAAARMRGNSTAPVAVGIGVLAGVALQRQLREIMCIDYWVRSCGNSALASARIS